MGGNESKFHENLVVRGPLPINSIMNCLILVLRLVLLSALLVGPTGCATTRDTTDDPPALEPSESHEDSGHGWGAGIGNAQ
jgi:hypothetical protein